MLVWHRLVSTHSGSRQLRIGYRIANAQCQPLLAPDDRKALTRFECPPSLVDQELPSESVPPLPALVVRKISKSPTFDDTDNMANRCLGMGQGTQGSTLCNWGHRYLPFTRTVPMVFPASRELVFEEPPVRRLDGVFPIRRLTVECEPRSANFQRVPS